MSDGSSEAGKEAQAGQDGGQQNDGGEAGKDKGQQQAPGLTQDQVNAIVADRLSRDRQARLNDPDFRTSALEAWKDDPAFKDAVVELVGPPKGGKGETAEQIAAARKEWEQQHLAPVKSDLEKKDQTIQSLRSKDLRGQILQVAAELGFKKFALTPPVEGADPPIVTMLSGVFGHDDQTDGWYVRNGDGFAYSATPTDNSPYKGVREFVREWAQKDEAKELLEPRTRSGSDYRGHTGGDARSVSVEDFKKMDSAQQRQLYNENRELYMELTTAMRKEGEGKLRAFR